MFYTNATKRFSLLNRYYKITRFYSFLKNTAYKGAFVIAIFVLLLIGLEYFIIDIDAILDNLVKTFSPLKVFSAFLISETVLGIVPPEIFIAWSSKSTSPWLFVFVLASLSYLGGIISYFIGNRIFLIPAVKNHIENKIANHIVNLRKWGGVFVFLGAVSPIPHSMVSLASGLIKYSFKQYLVWSLFRFLRFGLYALVIFQVFVA